MQLNKSKLACIVGILLIALFMWCSPFERQDSDFTKWLNYQAYEQEKSANDITDSTLRPFEKEGTHKEDGSHWSIPNVLRSLFS